MASRLHQRGSPGFFIPQPAAAVPPPSLSLGPPCGLAGSRGGGLFQVPSVSQLRVGFLTEAQQGRNIHSYFKKTNEYIYQDKAEQAD